MKAYIPEDIPVSHLDFQRLFKLVGEANGELARFDGLLQNLVQPELMLSPLIIEEAVLSSRIEGTQATIEDILKHDAGVIKSKDKQDDIQEVVNYRSAMNFASEQLLTRPLSLGFVREMHQILMQSVRGEDKSPGQFRTKQNFIGRPGCTLENATFVPPDPIRVQSDIEAWERYISGDDIEILLQCAVMHAQFELIHPFNDGNGRIGRLLIPLFLHQKRKLSRPAFYISAYLERNRDDYYGCLRSISQEKDWNSWIEFFFRAVTAQAKSNCKTVKEILNLYDEMKAVIQETTHSQYSIQVLDAIFQSPIFSSNEFVEKSGLAKKTANGLLLLLKRSEVILEITPGRGRIPALLTFKRLLDITEGRKIELK
ncbi:MAG: Fic family protein [Planctomycetaceae bacterium]|jgi:Fic family protein|nr:Fic family protein [Planctomycetaceae bacterium]